MNASIAIQVLPKVATNEETIRIVDEVMEYINGNSKRMSGSVSETQGGLEDEIKY